MKRFSLFFLAGPLLSGLIFLPLAFSQTTNETLTISTYYPSPYGVYNELRLYPKTTPTVCDSFTEGNMYYNSTTDQVVVCRDPSGWQSMSGLWTLNVTNLYPNNTTWNVGIGTNSPGTRLVVSRNTRLLPSPMSESDMQIGGADGSMSQLQIDSFGVGHSAILFQHAGGTVLSKFRLSTGEYIGAIRWVGYGASQYGGGSEQPRLRIIGVAAEDWSNSAQGAYLTFHTTPIGTLSVKEVMRIDDIGNVGIGTTSPSGKLEIKQLPNTSDPNLILSQSSNTWGNAPKLWFKRARDPGPPQNNDVLGSFVYSGYAGAGCVGTCAVGDYARGGRIGVNAAEGWTSTSHGTFMIFEVADVGASWTQEVMRIAPSGKVGIGTDNPEQRLHIRDNNTGGTRIHLENSDAGGKSWTIQSSGSLTNGGPGNFAINEVGAGMRLIIKAGGNVGIGTTDPKSKLQVVGLPVYANNAAAIAGGLTAGAFYRTGGDPDLVCVVH